MPERGAEGSKRPSCLSFGEQGEQKCPFSMQQHAFLSLIYYNRDELSYLNQQYTLGKDNNLLYIIETNTTPAKKWNKNTPKEVY